MDEACEAAAHAHAHQELCKAQAREECVQLGDGSDTQLLARPAATLAGPPSRLTLQQRQADAVAALLNTSDRLGMTPLHYAARCALYPCMHPRSKPPHWAPSPIQPSGRPAERPGHPQMGCPLLLPPTACSLARRIRPSPAGSLTNTPPSQHCYRAACMLALSSHATGTHTTPSRFCLPHQQ